MGRAEALHIEVVYCPRPGQTDRVALELPAGATLADALRASGIIERHGLDPASLRTGVWCRAQEAGAALRDHDRVEVYRGLTVDPKEARRLRYKRRQPKAAVR
ncbi:MAG: RnfH family protein [Rubrivivax sp.]|nr:RnfH family protein [Rubrivivax sp.]